LAYIFFSSSPIIANFSPFFLPMPPRRSQRKGAISAETIADSSSEEFVAVVSDEPYVFFFWVIMKNFLIRLCILYSLDSDEDERKSHKDNKHGKKNAKSVSFVGKKRARDVLENDDDL